MNHDHCLHCIRSSCKEYPTCPVEKCQNGCGATFHSCKWDEHEKYTCPEALVRCTNVAYGCRQLITKKDLGAHIQHCPASTIQCGFVYSRKWITRECEIQASEKSFIDDKLLEGDKNLLVENFSKRSSLDLSINDYGSACKVSRTLYSTSTPTRGRCFANDSFICNEIVRRDEFATHWQVFHKDVHTNMSMVIHRCPLQQYGCTYGRQNLVPSPLGTILDYSLGEDCFLVKPPAPIITGEENSIEFNDNQNLSQYTAEIQKKKELALYGYEEESYDVLCQLPAEVLFNVLKYLDSVSLWNLSLVNLYLRRICFDVVEKQGIVYFKWTKDSDSVSSSRNSEIPVKASKTKTGVRWINSPRILSFSKACGNIFSWMHSDTPVLSAHVMSCDVFKSISRNNHSAMKEMMAMIK